MTIELQPDRRDRESGLSKSLVLVPTEEQCHIFADYLKYLARFPNQGPVI